MFNESIYQFQIKDGQETITCQSYSDFLYKIRRIENGIFHVKITIHGQCDSPWIAIDSTDMYFKTADGKSFPVTYTDSDARLSFMSLVAAVKVITSESEKSKHSNYTYSDNAFKILAFFISEAARFEIIEHACYVMFNDTDTEYQWKDWKPMLNKWTNISAHADLPFTAHVKDPQVRPVPIASTQKNVYEPYLDPIYDNSKLLTIHQDVESKYLNLEFAMSSEPQSPRL